MIESEISILTAIDHPNIIQLEEVFDFPGEKYLVMEYVQVVSANQLNSFVTRDKIQGGDLFDAIATDIKYTEGVARDMIHDLADALQVSFSCSSAISVSTQKSFFVRPVPARSNDLPPGHQT